MELNDQQLRAADMMRSKGNNRTRIGVLTGGPGTGKTTVLKSVADASDLNCVFAAPTGKAAKRIAEVTRAQASTIHRLLGQERLNCHIEHMEKLPHTRIIVDEASMLDVNLAARLLAAVADHASIFFVGDVNQLPSIGAGSFLDDLIESGVVPVVRLTEVHRSAAESWVVRNAPLVIQQRVPDLEWAEDFEYHEASSEFAVGEAVLNVAMNALRAKESIQILTPQRAGNIGTMALNNRIQSRLFKKRKTLRVKGQEIGPGDNIIQTWNNYDLEVFNGEAGVVLEVTKSGCTVDFEGRSVVYSLDEAQDIMLAYALTIHKSQGSEWDNVVVVCHSAHSYMWNPRLLYTALTRARKKVILVGDDAGISVACSDKRTLERTTTMKDRILGLAP